VRADYLEKGKDSVMIQSVVTMPPPPVSPPAPRQGKLMVWVVGIISFGLLLLIIGQFAFEIFAPVRPSRFAFVKDIPLPSAVPTRFIPNLTNIPPDQGPLTPGVSVPVDHFDFQAIDPRTKLLFIAHSGPAPDEYALADHAFDPDKDVRYDGHIVVVDTTRNVVVGRVDVPQIAGIVVAPDLGRVYAADANDNIVYAIDEYTLKATAIQLADLEAPDGIDYDPDDHKVFVSDPGSPPDTNPNGNVSRDNQNLSVIDILHNNAVSRINLGHLPKLPAEKADLVQFGYDVGHNHYDPVLRRVFVTIQQLTDQSVDVPAIPPGGTGELVAVDPVTQRVVSRVQLPTTCGTPHGMNIDMQEQIAFIACTDVDPVQHLVQNLVRVNLRTMTVIHDPLMLLAAKPDLVILDHPLHILFVACSGGVSVFDESGGSLRKLGDYILGKGTHTLAVDETTQDVYLPLTDVGGRPVLRIYHFNPAGS
jgi:DNA-binding beta-propeller fold protein YncE